MKPKGTIQFEIAFTQFEQKQKQDVEEQNKALQEFIEENCSCLDSRDFVYYAERTGKDTKWLRANGNYEQSDLNRHIGAFIGSELNEDDLIGMNL